MKQLLPVLPAEPRPGTSWSRGARPPLFVGSGWIALSVFLLGVASFLGLNHVRQRAKEIAYDTMPGLSYAVVANASAGEAFNYTMLLLMTAHGEDRERLRRQILTSSKQSEEGFAAYKAAIFQVEDRVNFDQCMKQREEYLQIREELFSLLDRDRRAEAITRSQHELLPAYDRYRESAARLFSFNIQQGKDRGRTITQGSEIACWVVAGVAVVVFGLGFWTGMFKFSMLR